MEHEWFYADAAGQVGRVDIEDLKKLAASEANIGDLWVWRSGFDDWKHIDEVSELFQRRSPLDQTNPAYVPIKSPTRFIEPEPKRTESRRGLIFAIIVFGILLCSWGLRQTISESEADKLSSTSPQDKQQAVPTTPSINVRN